MYYRHPLSLNNLSDRITDERLLELTENIRQGTLSREEETELIEGHMRLILSLAQKWSARSPHLADIFVADGLFAALKAIRKAKDKLRPEYSLTQYIIINVKTAFKQAVINQQVMKGTLSDRNGDKVNSDGKGKEWVAKKVTLKRHGLPNLEAMADGWTPNNGVAKAMLPLAEVKLTARMDRVELREIIQMSTKCAQEEVVLEMKRQGYNINEIAERLGVNRARVRKFLNVIEARLRELLA